MAKCFQAFYCGSKFQVGITHLCVASHVKYFLCPSITFFPSVGFEGAEWDGRGARGPGQEGETWSTCKHEHIPIASYPTALRD